MIDRLAFHSLLKSYRLAFASTRRYDILGSIWPIDIGEKMRKQLTKENIYWIKSNLKATTPKVDTMQTLIHQFGQKAMLSA